MRRPHAKFFPVLFLMIAIVPTGQDSNLPDDHRKPLLLVSRTILIATIKGNGLFADTSPDTIDQSAYDNDVSKIQFRYELSNAKASKMIHVKFRKGTNVELPMLLLPPELQNLVVSIRRLYSLSDQDLNKIGASRLKLWFVITLKHETQMDWFIERLRYLEEVDIAMRAPQPIPPPLSQ